MTEQIYCIKCGTVLPLEAVFCSKCGTRTQQDIPKTPEPEEIQPTDIKPKEIDKLEEEIPNVFEILFSFKGRIGRLTYWSANVIISVIVYATATIFNSLSINASTAIQGLLFVLLILFLIVSYWSFFALLAKRWHDMGKSPWWSLSLLVPLWNLISSIDLLFTAGTQTKNSYGNVPRANQSLERTGIVLGIVWGLLGIYTLLSIIYPATAKSIPTRTLPTPIVDYYRPTPVISNSAPRATPTSACLRWDQITASMAGQDVCAYGTVSYHVENYQFFIYFGTEDQFFLTSTDFAWDNINGECALAKGTIQLNTYKVPYINIGSELYECETWMK